MANEGGSIRASYEIDFNTLTQQLKDVDGRAATANKRTDLAVAKARAAQKIVDKLDVSSAQIQKRVGKLGARLLIGEAFGGTIERYIDQSGWGTTAKGFSKIGINAAEGAFESGGNPLVIITKIAVGLMQANRELGNRIKAVEERQQAERSRLEALVFRSRQEQDEKIKELKEAAEKRALKVQTAAREMEYEVWKMSGGSD